MSDAQRWECTEREYFASPRLSRSRLEVFLDSPKTFALGEGLAESAAMRWGRLIHLRVLEPHEFRRRIYVKPMDLNRRSNAGKVEFHRIEADGMLVVSLGEEQRLEAINAAVLAHPLAGRMIERCDREVSYTWLDDATGIECRARLDLVRRRGEAIIDLKSCEDPSPRVFGQSAAKHGYHRQAAFYSRPIRELFGKSPAFCFIAARSTAPFEVVVYTLDPAQIEAADRQIDAAMKRLAACIDTNTWNAPWESHAVLPLEIPRWALEENL